MKKHVRIKTPPPLSPDSPDTLIRRVSNEGHTGSPPPQSPVEGVGNPQDPFDSQFANEIIASQSQEAIDNTRRNSTTTTSDAAPPAEAVVLNPFQSTLATIEPSKAKDEVQKKKEANASDAQKLGPGPAFDVDSFTQMLMTGRAPPIALSRGQDAQATRESPSNDTSQIRDGKESAASTVVNTSGSAPISTSYADLSSASSEDDSSQEEKHTPTAPPASKAPPPVPKHRHGRSIQESGPQTVSFANFETAPGSARKVLGESDASITRQASGSSDTAEPIVNRGLDSSKRARLPPPLPTTRRSNSTRSKEAHDGETSSIGSNQPHSPTNDAPLSPPLSKSHRAPPPPPSRRVPQGSKPAGDQSSSDMTSTNSENTSLAGDSIMSADSSSLRQTAAVPISGSRHSSGSAPTATTFPPPPPPRRRRGSSKSSAEVPYTGENRRTSQESSRNFSGLSQVSETGVVAKPTKDILADLNAFQAEVEALKEQSLRRAS